MRRVWVQVGEVVWESLVFTSERLPGGTDHPMRAENEAGAKVSTRRVKVQVQGTIGVTSGALEEGGEGVRGWGLARCEAREGGGGH